MRFVLIVLRGLAIMALPIVLLGVALVSFHAFKVMLIGVLTAMIVFVMLAGVVFHFLKQP